MKFSAKQTFTTQIFVRFNKKIDCNFLQIFQLLHVCCVYCNSSSVSKLSLDLFYRVLVGLWLLNLGNTVIRPKELWRQNWYASIHTGNVETSSSVRGRSIRWNAMKNPHYCHTKPFQCHCISCCLHIFTRGLSGPVSPNVPKCQRTFEWYEASVRDVRIHNETTYSWLLNEV